MPVSRSVATGSRAGAATGASTNTVQSTARGGHRRSVKLPTSDAALLSGTSTAVLATVPLSGTVASISTVTSVAIGSEDVGGGGGGHEQQHTPSHGHNSTGQRFRRHRISATKTTIKSSTSVVSVSSNVDKPMLLPQLPGASAGGAGAVLSERRTSASNGVVPLPSSGTLRGNKLLDS